MEEGLATSNVVYISSKSHLNLTFNLCECGVSELLSSGDLRLDDKDTFTLMCVRHGAVLLETNELAFRFGSTQGFFTFPDEKYDLKNVGEGTAEVVWLSFSGYQVENYLNRANIFRSKPVFADPDDYVGARMDSIYAASQKFPNRYCRMMSMLYNIFSHLLDANPTKNGDGYVDNSSFYSAKAVDFIMRNYTMDISVNDIAAALGITRKHLYSVFAKELKIAPKQYLICYRIEKACIRLKSTSQSVLEVAESVGYANQFYFTKEFKRLTGMSPTEYRKNPYFSEVLSYRALYSTLQGQFENGSVDFPLIEQTESKVVPPQQRGVKKDEPAFVK